MKGQTRTNGGNAREISLGKRVARIVASHYGVDDIAEFFVADHTHEGLRPECCSVAWEGHEYDWTVWWPESTDGEDFTRKHNVMLEAINGCILAVIPMED